jgi:hypothetical protein
MADADARDAPAGAPPVLERGADAASAPPPGGGGGGVAQCVFCPQQLRGDADAAFGACDSDAEVAVCAACAAGHVRAAAAARLRALAAPQQPQRRREAAARTAGGASSEEEAHNDDDDDDDDDGSKDGDAADVARNAESDTEDVHAADSEAETDAGEEAEAEEAEDSAAALDAAALDAEAAAAAAEKATATRRRQLCERVLTLCCPECKGAFAAFDGCAALTCGRCAAHFCAWCLAQEPSDDAAHEHVRNCAASRAPGQLYPPRGAWAAAQRERRAAAATAFIDQKCGDDADARNALLAACAADLEAHGITLLRTEQPTERPDGSISFWRIALRAMPADEDDEAQRPEGDDDGDGHNTDDDAGDENAPRPAARGCGAAAAASGAAHGCGAAAAVDVAVRRRRPLAEVTNVEFAVAAVADAAAPREEATQEGGAVVVLTPAAARAAFARRRLSGATAAAPVERSPLRLFR